MEKEKLLDRMQEIGGIIHQRRLACGYTLEEVGRAAGYPADSAQVQLSRIEQGRQMLAAERIRAIADLLSLPIAMLVP